MELSKQERLILINQYSILEKLDPECAEDYANKRTALEAGYSLHYSWLFERVSDDMSIEECKEVLSVLEMYRAIIKWYQDAKQLNAVGAAKYRFLGFDGNNESKQLAYCSYLIKREHRFRELLDGNDDGELNSHCPMLGKYRAMLAIWESYGDARFDLSGEQVEELLSAR